MKESWGLGLNLLKIIFKFVSRIFLLMKRYLDCLMLMDKGCTYKRRV
jgi:hypothetical protein